MNKKPTLKVSQTNWKRLEEMRDDEIDFSEIPEITAKQLKRSGLRVGGKPVRRGKVRVNLSLDASIIAYFKTQAGGQDYQKLINDALKAKIRDQNFESILRRVIREEMQAV